MDDPAGVSRLLLESATTLAQTTNARAIIVYVDALPELEAVPPRTVLVARDKHDLDRIEKFTESNTCTITVPNVTLDRFGQVKLAAIIALSNRIIDLGDTVIFLTGPFRSLTDSIVVMTIGAEYELFDTTEQPSIDEHIKRAVFHRVLSIALDLGQHGREGKPIGALLVVGDAKHVLEQSEQMILNPFKGYHEKQRNILDEQMTETVKEFSSLDGAFIIRGSGVIETAGARLKAGISEGLPSGLGARHAAAAGITANTKSIAITVSQSDGAVRVWRAGRMLASFESPGR
ncbi:MAG: DNA integrity scanning protein DisA nucleotide-binding domain protein [Planctomycetes bacterium]|nr:DNA integrity scanning protein DisA nucleotide-binding domain protein [Planctomycetota bacterium]